ncbi:MAG TPA: hypothetical protein VGL86_15430 [Polyangia bacterium]|jgi:hypothetical protein
MAHFVDNRAVGLAALPLVVSIVVAPAQLKMEAGAAPATVTVSAPGATHLRLWCSTGAIGRAQPIGAASEGHFAASFTPPPSGKPTFAVLAAWDEDSGEAATATVTLIGRSEIPVETEAGALVTATVHGRRSTARANAAGHARVPAWVWPGDRAATVSASDAAGNVTTSEVPLELPPPDGVFLLAPAEVAAGQPVRVWAFASSAVVPELAASGASLSSVERGPGATAATLVARASNDVALTATAGNDHAARQIRVATATAPPEGSIELVFGPLPELPPWAQQRPDGSTPSPATTPPVAPIAIDRPLSRTELGVALVGRFSGAFLGIGPTVEARRRLGRWFAVGADLDGRWAVGKLGGSDARGGGLGLRLAGDLRLTVAARVTLFATLGAGGHFARVRHAAATITDGGPSLSAVAGLLVRAGPGYVTASIGYAWTPLAREALANLDGGVLSVGYRVARWPRRRRRRRRRGGGTRSLRRRRRARGR